MDLFTDFSRSWADPQMRHALVVHWPVVMSVLSAVLALALAVCGAKNTMLRVLTLAACLTLMVSAWMAIQSGENAEHASADLSHEAHEVLEEHEELGEKAPLLGAICSALVAITFITYRPVRIGAGVLSVLACFGTAAWIAKTAHHGGLLVYEHGVGTPQVLSPSSVQEPPAAADGLSIAADDPRVAFFASEVRPILQNHCLECHNPQRARKSGGFDQSSQEKLLKGGRSGPAIVPGKPEESLFIQRIKGTDPEEDLMPPPPDPALTPEQIAKLEQWVRDGAVWTAD